MSVDSSHLTVVAMGQQAHQASLTQPLGLTAAQELVKDDLCVGGEPCTIPCAYTLSHLCTIGKVAKLCLPQNQAVGVFHAVPQLKAQHAKLAQRAVGHGEKVGLLPRVDVVERCVLLARLLVVQHGVAVAKGAALHVLPTETHMKPCGMYRVVQRAFQLQTAYPR